MILDLETSDVKFKANVLTVLVVEDETDLLFAIAKFLEKGGLQVLTAQDGQEAISILSEHNEALRAAQIDLIISDLLMPRMDGLTLLQKVRNGPDGEIPFLILSGTLDYNKVSQLISSGVDGILYKPFDKENLLAEVARTIERRRKRS